MSVQAIKMPRALPAFTPTGASTVSDKPEQQVSTHVGIQCWLRECFCVYPAHPLTRPLPGPSGSWASRPTGQAPGSARPTQPQLRPVGAPWLQEEYGGCESQALGTPRSHPCAEGCHLGGWQAHRSRGRGPHELEAGLEQSAAGSAQVDKELGTQGP